MTVQTLIYKPRAPLEAGAGGQTAAAGARRASIDAAPADFNR